MPFARSNTLLILFTTALTIALVVLVSSQHRSRLIFGSYTVVDTPDTLEGSLSFNSGMRFMPAVMHVPINTGTNGMSEAVDILTKFSELHPLVAGNDLPSIDNPDSCEHDMQMGKRLHCYNVDIGTCKILSGHGIRARMWDMYGSKELGGFGHNLLEVFDGPTKTWRVLDPYYHCYFTSGHEAAALSFASLRKKLLNEPLRITIVRYYHALPERRDTDIICELRFLAPCSILHANNDFMWRYQHRYGFLMPVARVVDRLPLRVARGVRTVMLGACDDRYIVEDVDSPHYPIVILKVSFYTILLLWIISMGLLFRRIFVARKMRTTSIDGVFR